MYCCDNHMKNGQQIEKLASSFDYIDWKGNFRSNWIEYKDQTLRLIPEFSLQT